MRKNAVNQRRMLATVGKIAISLIDPDWPIPNEYYGLVTPTEFVSTGKATSRTGDLFKNLGKCEQS
jgi:hypothetical protein